MAANIDPIFGLICAAGAPATIVNADGTAKKTIFTADATNGSILTGIAVTSDDTADRVLNVYLTLGGTDYLVGAVPVPLTAGSVSTVPAVNLLALSYLPWLNGDGTWGLSPGAIVKVAVQVAVTAAKTITIAALGMNY
jgi:hypothetical protein